MADLRRPYEALALMGEWEAQAGDALRDAGEYGKAGEAYGRAGAALDRALGMTPSYPEALDGLCRLRNGALELESMRGGDAGAAYRRALEPAGARVALDPSSPAGYRLRSRAHLAYAQHRLDVGMGGDDPVRGALEDAREELARDFGSAGAWRTMATAWRVKAKLFSNNSNRLGTEAEKLPHARLCGVEIRRCMAEIAKKAPLECQDYHAESRAMAGRLELARARWLTHVARPSKVAAVGEAAAVRMAALEGGTTAVAQPSEVEVAGRGRPPWNAAPLEGGPAATAAALAVKYLEDALRINRWLEHQYGPHLAAARLLLGSR